MNQIETKLQDTGWIQDADAPLVLGTSMLDLIDEKFVDDEGNEHVIQSAALFHKGDRYVFSWTRWDQSVMEGRITLEDRKGTHSDGAIHFDPNVEAVRANFSHVLTVNVEESTIRVWKKATK